jgi:hypothetical protein
LSAAGIKQNRERAVGLVGWLNGLRVLMMGRRHAGEGRGRKASDLLCGPRGLLVREKEKKQRPSWAT